MTYEQLAKENEILKQEIKTLKEQLRTKGKPQKFNEAEALKIQEEYSMGMSIRKLAQKYDCSIGLIHKVIHLREGEGNV